MEKEFARQRLRESSLRITGPRLAVIKLLAEATTPLSYSEVLQRLGETDWDDATVYRNLVKLCEVGIACVASRVHGIDRYAFVASSKDDHEHAHFVCDQCGLLACLPKEVSLKVAKKGQWSASLRAAKVQLSGECPDCLMDQSRDH